MPLDRVFILARLLFEKHPRSTGLSTPRTAPATRSPAHPHSPICLRVPFGSKIVFTNLVKLATGDGPVALNSKYT